MAQKSGIYRRPSGIYVLRLVVPERLREAVGRREVHVSTGTRSAEIAKLVAASASLHWRQKFLALERLTSMNIQQIVLGSPALTSGGHISLQEAAVASGFTDTELLRKVESGLIPAFVRLSAVPGHTLPEAALEREVDAAGVVFVAPSPTTMPVGASPVIFSGTAKLRGAHEVAAMLIDGAQPELVLVDLPDRPGVCLVPEAPLRLTIDSVELLARDVEAMRVIARASVTPQQLEASRAAASPVYSASQPDIKLSARLDAYMKDRGSTCALDQAQRVRSACELFIELMGDPSLQQIDRDLLRHYRDNLLPRCPADLHLLRSKHPEAGVSMTAAITQAPSSWPRLSAGERKKRMTWLSQFLKWLKVEGHIAVDPSEGLAQGVLDPQSTRKKRKQDSREVFSIQELRQIFGATWYRTGRGELSKAGTYREFLPLYYWLPLLGLHTGARINELCQLKLHDFRQTSTGVWFIAITDDGDDQKVKTSNSLRNVPLHQRLVDLGLIAWLRALEAAGHDRLFPELRHDPVKGYSKDAVKWFSRYLAGFGWPRDGTKTFHSLRHTFATHCVNEIGAIESVVLQMTA